MMTVRRKRGCFAPSFLPFCIQLQPEQLAELWLVKTDDDVIADLDNWHTHLTSKIDHLLTLSSVSRNIMISEGNIVLLKEVLCRVTKMTYWSAINSDVCS